MHVTHMFTIQDEALIPDVYCVFINHRGRKWICTLD